MIILTRQKQQQQLQQQEKEQHQHRHEASLNHICCRNRRFHTMSASFVSRTTALSLSSLSSMRATNMLLIIIIIISSFCSSSILASNTPLATVSTTISTLSTAATAAASSLPGTTNWPLPQKQQQQQQQGQQRSTIFAYKNLNSHQNAEPPTSATFSPATTTTTTSTSTSILHHIANNQSFYATFSNYSYVSEYENENDASRTSSNYGETQISFHEYCIAHRNSFADVFTLILYSFVCIVGLFGNTLVIYVVLRFSKMQTVTNIYILNLAIADECFLIGIPFLLYTMRICSWRFGEFMCKAYMVSTSITQFTSSIFLLIMSADRYIAVCHPISSPRYRTLHIAKIVSAVAWSTSAILMLPVILYASTVSQEDGINLSCNIEWPESYKKHSGTTFILYTFFLGFAIPLCFILCFYYLVIRKLQTVGPKSTTKSKEKKRAHRKVTRLVLTVITVYICCWLPHWISQVALINSNPAQRDLSRLEILIFLLLGCLVYSNSAVNPILYAFLSDNFRKSFFKAFTCISRQDINAQLNIEPSVFTKQGSRRRGGSRRLLSPPQPPMLGGGLTLNAGNNNSSTTTSSTTTAEKTGSTAANKSTSSNGRLANASLGTTTQEAENSIIRLDAQHEAICTLVNATSTSKNLSDANRRWSVVDVQQTDF